MLEGGSFPRASYCLETQVVLGGGSGGNDGGTEGEGTKGADERIGTGGGVVLLGDAIHVFPPDLGAGVNMGFLDVLDLMDSLDQSGGGTGNEPCRCTRSYARPRAERYVN